MSKIKINIAGDIFLGRRLSTIAHTNPSELFDNAITQLFRTSDYNIINLESPISDSVKDSEKIIKTGPHLKASEKSIVALEEIEIDLVTLANNHIYDYGQKGLEDTLKTCAEANLSTVGAGLDKNSAAQPFIKEINDTKIGIINVAENEWSNANDIYGGANPLDTIDNSLAIRALKKEVDTVIVIIHGGHENYSLPSPRMVKQYRYFADQGASVIIGHHAHSLSGYEVYNGTPIYYGIGNFLFSTTRILPGWNDGMVVSIEINEDHSINTSHTLYQQCKKDLKVSVLTGAAKEKMEKKIIGLNEIITNPELLKKNFLSFAQSDKDYVLSVFSTVNFFNSYFLSTIIRKLKLNSLFLRKKQLKSILNYVRCEAHKDIIEILLEDYVKK